MRHNEKDGVSSTKRGRRIQVAALWRQSSCSSRHLSFFFFFLTSLLKFASLVHLWYQLSGVSFLENELRNGDLLAGGFQGVCSGVNHQGALWRV